MRPPATGPDGQAGDLLAQLLAWQPAPPPFATGSHPLWTDPPVAASMLRTHLDPQTDAASRRPETIDATVGWLAGWLPAGARVLDLGCGPGLYAGRLADAGFAVTGVDFSRTSLDHAAAHTRGVRYLAGDYCTIDLDEAFDAVLLIYLDYGALSPPRAARVLAQVRRWLAPGGVFVVDVPTAEQRLGTERHRDWGVAAGGFWTDLPHAWMSRTLRYDDADPAGPAWLDEHVVITAEETKLYRVWERCFTEPALRAELAAAGLAVRSVHGDLAGAPFVAGESPVLGVVATAAQTGPATPTATQGDAAQSNADCE